MSENLAKFLIENSYPKLVTLVFLALSGLILIILRALGELSSLIEQKMIAALIFMFILGISYVAVNGLKNASRNNRY